VKTPISIGICTAIFLGTAEGSARQQEKSPGPATENGTLKSIACSQETGESLGRCTYRINRDDDGTITVTVVFANSFKRKLFFKDGKFLKANTTMSGTGTDTDWSLKDGTLMIRVDDQRYEVPETLIADP